MKRSLACMSALVGTFVCVVGLGVTACANTEDAPPPSPPPDDTEDAAGPIPERDAGGPAPDASVEAGTRVCSYDGFCPTIVPPSQTLTGVWGDGTGVAWAVSSEGSVLRWDGVQWKIHASDLGTLTAVWGSGPTDVWIGGDRGLRHGTGSSSATLTFASSDLPLQWANIASIWGLSANDLWAVGTAQDRDTGATTAAAFHLNSKGSFDAGTISAGTQAYTHVWGSAGSGVWIAGTRPMVDTPWMTETVVFREPVGEKFAEIALPPDPHVGPPLGTARFVRSAIAVSDTSIWLNGESVSSPLTWRATSSDNGKTFTFTAERDLSNAPQYFAIGGTSANDVWMVGDYGQARHWDGTKWTGTAVTNTNLPVTNSFYAVWARSPSEVWFVGKDIALRYDAAMKESGGVQ